MLTETPKTTRDTAFWTKHAPNRIWCRCAALIALSCWCLSADFSSKAARNSTLRSEISASYGRRTAIIRTGVCVPFEISYRCAHSLHLTAFEELGKIGQSCDKLGFHHRCPKTCNPEHKPVCGLLHSEGSKIYETFGNVCLLQETMCQNRETGKRRLIWTPQLI